MRRLGIALAGVVAAAAVAALTSERERDIQSAPVPVFTSSGADIAFYERRIIQDPQSAADRARLSALYLQRARETGSPQDFNRAAESARESLTLRTAHNGDAYALLTAALLATHDFPGALRSARALFETDTTNASYRAQLAEVELELGNYDRANRLFTGVAREADKPTIAARLARWYEVTGRLALARGVLRRAADRLTRIPDVPREQAAWFHYRVGELEMRAGRFASADSALRRALEVFPDDYRALGALARLSLLRGDWESAIAYGTKALAIQLDPATLGTMSEAYAAGGDSAQARSFADAMAASALGQPGSIHRAWALFLLDHGRDIERVLADARSGLAERRDVYAYDVLAWALYKSGHVEEARRAAETALAQGTEDAQLFHHAGMIALAARDTVEGRTLLERARALNPRFGARQPAIAATPRAKAAESQPSR